MVCSPVNATRVPIVMPPEVAGSPAARYSSAGMAEKMMLIVAIRHRPDNWERTSRSTSRVDVSEKRSDSAGPAPSVLPSCTPLIDSPSSIWVCMSASAFCRCAVISRRMSATLRVSHIAGGSTINDSNDSRQLSTAIAIAVPITVVTLDAIDVAVDVTTVCMPPMSLVSRDWTSPPRVRVKKPSDWRCRCVNTRVRRLCMIRCPTVVEIHVCTTPNTAVATVIASIATTAHTSSVTFCSGIARSITSRTRNGLASEIADDATISATTTVICHRYGAKSAPIRRRLTGDSSSWARSAGSTLRVRIGPPPGPPNGGLVIAPPLSDVGASLY
ncbi:hypothetical protein RE9416_08150 [Prescottella equi]|nr:hypothetical protein RE9416_08150 [Prescottella equi]